MCECIDNGSLCDRKSPSTPAAHERCVEVIGHVPGPKRRQSGSVLTSDLVALAPRHPPVQSLLAIKLLDPTLLGQVVHAMVDLFGLAQSDIPVSEESPVALAVQEPTLMIKIEECDKVAEKEGDLLKCV